MSYMHDDGDCNDARHTLYSFLDGELTDDRRTVIQAHLEKCPPCFEAFDFEAELRMVIAQKCRDRVPESLRMRIAGALQIDPGPGSLDLGPGGIPTL